MHLKIQTSVQEMLLIKMMKFNRIKQQTKIKTRYTNKGRSLIEKLLLLLSMIHKIQYKDK